MYYFLTNYPNVSFALLLLPDSHAKLIINYSLPIFLDYSPENKNRLKIKYPVLLFVFAVIPIFCTVSEQHSIVILQHSLAKGYHSLAKEQHSTDNV